MECLICKNGITAPGYATTMIDRDGHIIVFKNVKAEICNNCGEYYLDEATTKMVHAKADLSIENGEELAVIRL